MTIVSITSTPIMIFIRTRIGDPWSCHRETLEGPPSQNITISLYTISSYDFTQYYNITRWLYTILQYHNMTFHNISISQYDFKQYHITQYHHMTLHNVTISQDDFTQYYNITIWLFTIFQYHNMTLNNITLHNIIIWPSRRPLGPNSKLTFSLIHFLLSPSMSYIVFNVVESFKHSTRVESKSQRPDYHFTEYHYDQVQGAPWL